MVIVDKSLDVVGSVDGIPATFTFTKATNFTASFNYAPNVQAYVTSSNIKQSFLQFTFTDLQPISGQVNSVRVFYKLANAVSDYKLLTQEFIRPIEYLTDARYVNQSGYGQEISKYLLIGHFTTQSIVNDYWTFGYQDEADIDVYRTPSQQYGTPLIDSIRLYPSKSRSEFCHTTYYQNYSKGQQYTATFYVVLDPEVDLEVYLTSTSYKPTLFGDNTFPLAFRNSTNFDKTTGNKGVNPYGKFVGKITNTNSLRTFYDKVGFDFEPDDDGLGKLLLRAVPRNSNSVGYAFISKISVTPKMLTGFTPSLFQFTTPATNEFFTQISQSLDFKISYHDYTGKQSEYETYVLNVPYGLQVDTLGSTCQAEQSRTWDFKFPYYAMARSGSGVTSTNYFTSSLIPFTNETVYGGFQEIVRDYTLLLETSSRNIKDYPLNYNINTTTTHSLSGSFNIEANGGGTSMFVNIAYYPPNSTYIPILEQYVAPTYPAGTFATFSISQSFVSGGSLIFNAYGGNGNGVTLDLKISTGTSGSYIQRVWPLTASGSTNQRWQYGKALGNNPQGTPTPTSKNPTTYDSYWNAQIPTIQSSIVTALLFSTSSYPLGETETYLDYNVAQTGTYNITASYIADPGNYYDVSSAILYYPPVGILTTITESITAPGGSFLYTSSYYALSGSRFSFTANNTTLYSATISGPASGSIVSWTPKYTESIQNDAAQGMVTSSWKWLDQFYLNFISTGSTINQQASEYLSFAYGPYVSSSIDNRKFNAAGFLGITKTDVSNSYASQSREFGNSTDNLRTRSEALKKRKLLWPVNGPTSASYFVENGGIYNVQFKLARTGSYSPDSGSYLMVYIFNANADLINENPFPGSKGFRPPDQNIVKIGNGYTSGSVTTPLLTWYNEEDNTYYEQYDINLIQWGTPAQLVFEPGYSIPTAPYSASFGCLITDVSFCKIGVTTDTTYLKPQNFQEFVTPYYENIKTITGENTLIPIRR
jgi:hypothetical protein